jgi:hypothetical protein
LDAAAAAKMSNGFDLRLEVVLRVEKRAKSELQKLQVKQRKDSITHNKPHVVILINQLRNIVSIL